jgi:hypothetical protein
MADLRDIPVFTGEESTESFEASQALAETRVVATEEALWTDPDWDCPRCRSVNFAIRSRCRICNFDSALVSNGICLEPEVIPVLKPITVEVRRLDPAIWGAL